MKSFWSVAGVLVLGSFVLGRAYPQAVLTQRNDNQRTGANVHETILTPKNVNPNSFGRLYTLTVVGTIGAQPLFVANVPVGPQRQPTDLLYIATRDNNIYAFNVTGEYSGEDDRSFRLNVTDHSG
jgi:hypothetical protein